MHKPHPPNPLLESDVKESFDWDRLLDDERIVVKADDGRIVLSGVVRTFDQIERAVGDAWAVCGVKAVDNELLVGPRGAAVADGDLAGPRLVLPIWRVQGHRLQTVDSRSFW